MSRPHFSLEQSILGHRSGHLAPADFPFPLQPLCAPLASRRVSDSLDLVIPLQRPQRRAGLKAEHRGRRGPPCSLHI